MLRKKIIWSRSSERRKTDLSKMVCIRYFALDLEISAFPSSNDEGSLGEGER
jgi:hypothetical protein